MVSIISNSSLNLNTQQISSKKENKVGFSSKDAGKTEYKNPVNPTTEKALACIAPTALSVVLGAVVGYAANKLIPAVGKKSAIAVGVVVAVISGLMSIPGAVYKANVNASMKKEQYDPFEAGKKAETALQRQLLEIAKDNPDALSKNADIALKLGLAKNGNGMAIVTPNA